MNLPPFLRLLLLALLLPGTQAAIASEQDGAYIAVMGLGVLTGDDRDTDTGVGIRGAYGHPLQENWFLELGGYSATLETDRDGTDIYTWGLGLDLARHFGDGAGLTPFLIGGLGGSFNDLAANGKDDTSGTLNVGAGLISKRLGQTRLHLRAEARYVRDFYADDLEDVHVAIGIQLPLGRVERETVTERVIVTETREVAVIAADSDGDSVPDDRDACPDTLEGARVDARGCIISGQVLTIQNINFKTGSAELLTSSHPMLEAAARALASQPGLNLTIDGHTDSRGDASYNLALSQQRARSVQAYLIELGISAERLTAVGHGESRPVASNDDAEGRAMNRRVEFGLDNGGFQP